MAKANKRVYGPPPSAGLGPILTNDQVNAIRNVTSGTVAQAAKKFGVSETTVSAIWANKGRYADIPFK